MNFLRWLGRFFIRHLTREQNTRHDELQAQKQERHDLINHQLAPAAIEAQNLDERVQRLERKVGLMRRDSDSSAHPTGT